MPAGRYEFSDYIEDDVVTDIPIRLKVALTIGDGEIHLDFTGQRRAGGLRPQRAHGRAACTRSCRSRS